MRNLLLVILMLCPIFSIATDTPNPKVLFPWEKEYLASYPLLSKGISIRRTPLYVKGLEHLYLSHYFKKESINSSVLKQEIEGRIPDYQKIFSFFKESFEKEKNLAAAYFCMRLLDMGINFGMDQIQQKVLYFNFANALAQANNCLGLYKKGVYFSYGIGGVIEDKKFALKTLNEASAICKKSDYIIQIDFTIKNLKGRK